MRRLVAVAFREITERRFVLVAAAAAAVIPFLVPLLPGVPADQDVVTRGIVALVLAAAFGLGGSLLVGASVVGRDLAERRLSFHFSRPLPSPVIWGGKLAGGLALVLLAELIVFLPSSAAGGRFPGLWGGVADSWSIWACLCLAVPLFLISWVGSVALRSRSPWLVADLALLVALPAALFVIGRRFIRYGQALTPSMGLTAIGVLLLALLAATFAQVVVGRTDGRRGHGAQSLTLWGVLLAATAAGAAWGERVIDPGIRRLVRTWAEPAGAAGDRVFVRGSTSVDERSGSLYLLDLRNGRETLLPMSYAVLASADGSRAAIVRGESSTGRVELEAIEVATGDFVVLDLPEWPDGVALAPDGRRLAVASGGICRVVELPSLRLLASARIPATTGWVYAPRFVSPDRVRLYPLRAVRTAPRSPRRSIVDPEVSDFQVSTRSLVRLARYPISTIPFRSVKPEYGLPSEPHYTFLPSPDSSRVLVLAFGAARSIRLLDASTGRVLASIDGPEGAGGPAGVFTADGRVVVAEWVDGGRQLAVLSPDGERLSSIPLPVGRKSVRIGYEPAPGLIAVGVYDDSKGEHWDWFLVDLGSARLKPLALEPLAHWFWPVPTSVPAPGSPATRLAHDKGSGRLVLFDPATGSTTPIDRGKATAK